MNFCILGAGAWGTALAMRLAVNGHQVNLWGRDQSVCDQINTTHQTPYLEGVALSNDIKATTDLQYALKNIDYIL